MGFIVTERRPVLGAVLLVIGAVCGATMMFWFLFIPPVVALAVVAFGIHRARGFTKLRRLQVKLPNGTAGA